MRKNIRVIAVVGPTASGKSEVGVRLAQAFDGEVICVDSRTVYKEMDVGTAKPTGVKGEKWQKRDPEDKYDRGGVKEEKALPWDINKLFEPSAIVVEGVPHWGINLVKPDEPFTVADFVAYTTKKIADVYARGKTPILVGGTGLYFRALLDGLTLTDVEPDPALRVELEAKSTEELAELLGEYDPDAIEGIDVDNRRRLIRALEIVMTTGETLASQQKKVVTPYDVCYLGVEIEREALYERINARVDQMIALGLIDEARVLQKKYGIESPAMTGIGYRQLAAFFAGRMPLRDAVEKIKVDTRHYAKRQLTWFKADARVQWIADAKAAIAAAHAWGFAFPVIEEEVNEDLEDDENDNEE